MRVLIIPDVHLKDWMFSRADALMQNGVAEKAVCLMDLPDDWHREYDIDSYIRTFDAAITFARKYPETLWCYGNHDLCYLWNFRETGYSPIAPATVCYKLRQLDKTVPEGNIAYVHRIDNVLFCHGGISERFVEKYAAQERDGGVDAVIHAINKMGPREMWQDASPLWYRPQMYSGTMYKADGILQVVGHTPVHSVERNGSVVSCDVFSTTQTRVPIGTEEFPVIDTLTWDIVCYSKDTEESETKDR